MERDGQPAESSLVPHPIVEGRAASVVSLAAFANSYARLPANFYARTNPTPVAEPQLIMANALLARELGLAMDGVDAATLADVFSGNRLMPGSEPLAMAYAGHQFGGFVPQLGDGRAILLGEIVDRQGRRRDIQLKGAGRTPFSRSGDGRAALGPVLREYLVSEAMNALGVPSTRALAAVTTGEPVYREARLPGAILTRVATGHVRVGTFQYFAARGDSQSVARLTDYVIERHYPEAAHVKRPCLALLDAFADRQAQLIARWMHVGFIHGVMNTDNMALSGETIDFGPCAFLDAYDPQAVFSAIDQFGRYAFANQPSIGQWNLARFAECLLPIINPDRNRAIELATDVVVDFPKRFQAHWLAGMRRKLGLFTEAPGDRDLIDALLTAMHDNQADFTLTFRNLSEVVDNEAAAVTVRALFGEPQAYDVWAPQWQARLAREPRAPALRSAAMRAINPAVIPRNHIVEQALGAALDQGDFSPFKELLVVLAKPYDEPASERYTRGPRRDEKVFQTFCGT
jgi:uncharacterized protein YdiU (UPF0061 family)